MTFNCPRCGVEILDKQATCHACGSMIEWNHLEASPFGTPVGPSLVAKKDSLLIPARVALIGTVVTLVSLLLVVGVFVASIFEISRVVNDGSSATRITLYLHDDAADKDVKELKAYIESLPDVDTVGYVSKDEALESFSNAVGEEAFKELELEGNPLPASLEIALEDSGDAQSIVELIAEQSTFPKVVDSPDDPMDSLRYSGQDFASALFVYEVVQPTCITLIIILAPLTLVFIIALVILRTLRRRREENNGMYLH